MYVGDFARLVWRNAYRGGQLRFELTRWGRRNLAPDGVVTLLDCGHWVNHPRHSFDDRSDRSEVWWEQRRKTVGNVPRPWLPVFQVQVGTGNDPNDRIVAKSWRTLLRLYLMAGLIRPSAEIKALLGPRVFDIARRARRAKGNPPW